MSVKSTVIENMEHVSWIYAVIFQNLVEEHRLTTERDLDATSGLFVMDHFRCRLEKVGDCDADNNVFGLEDKKNESSILEE